MPISGESIRFNLTTPGGRHVFLQFFKNINILRKGGESSSIRLRVNKHG